jgi:hypothetical protein
MFLYCLTPVLVKRIELTLFYLVTITIGLRITHTNILTAVELEVTYLKLYKELNIGGKEGIEFDTEDSVLLISIFPHSPQDKSRRTTWWLVVKKTVLGLHVTLGHTLVLQLDVLLLDWALGIDKTKNYIRSGEFHN